jgi:hypothetical protein
MNVQGIKHIDSMGGLVILLYKLKVTKYLRFVNYAVVTSNAGHSSITIYGWTS